MLLIKCPWCGERAQTEFSYGGDATLARPDPDSLSDQEWTDFVYIRKNPKGPHDELWQHISGCRQFFKVRRNVVTHEILDTAPADGKLNEGNT